MISSSISWITVESWNMMAGTNNTGDIHRGIMGIFHHVHMRARCGTCCLGSAVSRMLLSNWKWRNVGMMTFNILGTTSFFSITNLETHLPGWWFEPLWNIWKSIGMIIANISGKIKLMATSHHQPAIVYWVVYTPSSTRKSFEAQSRLIWSCPPVPGVPKKYPLIAGWVISWKILFLSSN